jgi:hypothetical protein
MLVDAVVQALRDDVAVHRGASGLDMLPAIAQHAQQLADIFAEVLLRSDEDTASSHSAAGNSDTVPSYSTDSAFLTLDSAVAADLREEFECRSVGSAAVMEIKSVHRSLCDRLCFNLMLEPVTTPFVPLFFCAAAAVVVAQLCGTLGVVTRFAWRA